MKNQAIALGAAALLAAPFATPALADPTGFISIGAGPAGTEIEFPGGSDSIDGYAIEALLSGAIMLTPVLGIQGDIQFASRTLDEAGNDVTTNSFDGALHGFYREADKFLVGGFVQIGRDDVSYDSLSAGTIDRAYVGGEAQVYFDNLTLYGQAGMQQFDSGSGPMSIGLSGWFANAEARYFLTPNLRIEARAGFSTLELELLSAAFDTVSIGAGIEYKLESLPVSLFATYDYSTSSFDVPMGGGEPTIGDHRLLVGARFALGEDSLIDRDRSGASLRPVQGVSSLFGGFGGIGGP
ncbi:hypothetical protein VW23_016165 [Devosia insulae DS-56]|uniref:Outer membrane protein beta-barrel domain-containing protein n=1 Tax=Devosia insulae DS-56 TaxID=1116389 RepID=A0A1E5XS77_9HYPH|nr:hypothetical protein [Devosia insulae]OEO31440.1 hypothetical protein VW23_016165 [Devosia insulae DS-56]